MAFLLLKGNHYNLLQLLQHVIVSFFYRIPVSRRACPSCHIFQAWGSL